MDPVETEAPPELVEGESDLEDELTVLEYARFQKIALDHLNPEIPQADLREAHQKHEIIHLNRPFLIPEHEKLPTVSKLLPEGHKYLKESPAVPRETLSFLATVTGNVAYEIVSLQVEEYVSNLLDVRTKGSNLDFLELPILRSDPELDLANFGGREEPVVEDLHVPREPIDETRGHGLQWGIEMTEVVEEIHETVAGEKVIVQSESLRFLLSAMRDEWSEDDELDLWNQQLCYNRNKAPEPLTPPLEPRSIPSTPFVPSSSVMEVPLLSDPPSLISEDLKVAEVEAFKNDTITLPNLELNNPELDSSDTMVGDPDIDLGQIFFPLASFEATDTTPEPRSTRPSDYKVETPLPPPNPVPRKVTFNHIIEECMLDLHTDEGRASIAPSQNSFEYESQYFFEEAIAPIAETVNRKVEQEQLKSADSLARIKIPVMDFSLPPPPWAQLLLNGSTVKMLAYQRASIRDAIEAHSIPKIWPGSKKMEKELRWIPFSSELAKVAIDEQIDGEDALAELLSVVSIREVVDSSSLTWKPEGLRILKDTEDEDEDGELELGHFYEKQPQDLTSLVRRRNLELQEERNDYGYKDSDSGIVSGTSEYRSVENMLRAGEPRVKKRGLTPIQRTKTPLPDGCQALLTLSHQRPGSSLAKENPLSTTLKRAAPEEHSKPKSPGPSLLLGGGLFSAGNALDNFMEIRGSKKQKLTDSTYFNATTKPTSNSVQSPPLLPTAPPTQSIPQPIPLPQIPPDQQQIPRNMIISSKILQNRPLINHLTNLLPHTTIIERDFSAHNTTTWLSKISVQRSPIASPLDSEADIIISASTGIILTSLQAIKQKPLPGSKARNKVIERICSVAARYEKIFVFVAGIDAVSVVLNEDDCGKLAEFMGFCCAPFVASGSNSNRDYSNQDGIDTTSPTIIINFTPGPPSTMATHIASTLIKHSSPSPDSFLEEETVWELFLRRAGLNAWAAQSLIGPLKGLEEVGGMDGMQGMWGIRAFVEMSGEERVLRFGALVERRVLERVGEAVDKWWGEYE